jgi:hypothetical protein
MGKKIKCKYIFADDYNPVCVNGAFGGVNPQGEIVINFYFERAALPNSQTYEIVSKKLKEIESEREPRDLSDSFVRVVNTGIILDYRHAKIIYEWLGENIKKLESHTNERTLPKK